MCEIILFVTGNMNTGHVQNMNDQIGKISFFPRQTLLLLYEPLKMFQESGSDESGSDIGLDDNDLDVEDDGGSDEEVEMTHNVHGRPPPRRNDLDDSDNDF